jgi:hypothetical protein
VYTWAAGGRYEGEWKDDSMHGRGVYRDKDGKTVRGRWNFDEYVGEK